MENQFESEAGMDREEYEYNIIAEIFDSVSKVRGLGYSGEEVRIVERECPTCGHDRMIQEIRVQPEHPDTATYQCQHPGCPKHHEGNVRGARHLFR